MNCRVHSVFALTCFHKGKFFFFFINFLVPVVKKTYSSKAKRLAPPEPPKLNLYADAKEFKKGRHTASEVKSRKWKYELASFNSGLSNAELETQAGLLGSPAPKKAGNQKNGRYCSKIIRGEVGATSEQNKDRISRAFRAKGFIPEVSPENWSLAAEISFGTIRNFDERWPSDPSQPADKCLIASANEEVLLRVNYQKSIDQGIKKLIKQKARAIREIEKLLDLQYRTGILIADSQDDEEKFNGNLPSLTNDLYDIFDRLYDCKSIALVCPPASHLRYLHEKAQGKLIFYEDPSQFEDDLP
jgi:hypothetical protein